MSSAPGMRRHDLVMSEEQTVNSLEQGFSGWLATVGEGGMPYCTPMLYVCMDGKVYLHSTRAKGMFRRNIDSHAKVSFGVDKPDEIYAYGRFECDSALAYESVILSGVIEVIEDDEIKQRFCERLMKKYGQQDWGRPTDVFPRLNQIAVYAITIERLSGKKIELPGVSQQWPAIDRTKTPNANP